MCYMKEALGDTTFFSGSSGLSKIKKYLIFFVSANSFTCSSNHEPKYQENNEDYLEI